MHKCYFRHVLQFAGRLAALSNASKSHNLQDPFACPSDSNNERPDETDSAGILSDSAEDTETNDNDSTVPLPTQPGTEASQLWQPPPTATMLYHCPLSPLLRRHMISDVDYVALTSHELNYRCRTMIWWRSHLQKLGMSSLLQMVWLQTLRPLLCQTGMQKDLQQATALKRS